ncbi:hypothetical protein [Pseudoneobacillus sp. C159]
MKKLLIIVLIGLVIGIGVFIWKGKSSSIADKGLLLTEDQLKNPEFLTDKQAVLYYSTTADQDFDNKGVSLAIFIDDEGKATAYQMKGLELGSVAQGENKLLLTDKNKITLLGDHYKSFPQEKPQYTGERTGYLKQDDVFFSIYNTGVNSQTGSYDSNVLFGNESGFQFDNIPHYILTSGVTNSLVPILTYDVEKNLYDLREVAFSGKKLSITDVVRLQNKENYEYANLSPIVTDEEFYYFVLSEFTGENSGNVVLFKINKETKEQVKIQIAQYVDSEKTFTSIPFNVKSSAYVLDGDFYYIDGLGDVYRLKKGSAEVERKFTIDNPPKDGVRHGEGTFFHDGQLHILRNEIKSNKGFHIETYSLTNGNKEAETLIENINEILSQIKDKSLHTYDFKTL